MNRWRDRYQPVLDEIAQLEKIVEDLAGRADETQLHELSRLRRAVASARKAVEAADADLVTADTIRALSAQIAGIRGAADSQLTAAGADGPIDLIPVNDAADGLLDVVPPRTRFGRGERESIAAVLESLQKDAEALIAGLRARTSEAAAALEGLHQQGEEANTARAAAEAALDARLTEMGSAVEQQVARLESALQDQGGRFDEAQESRRAEFSELIKSQEAATSTAVTEIVDQARMQAEEFAKAAEQRIANLDASQQEAERMLGAIARSGMTKGYQEYADAEIKTADKFRRYTIWGAIGVIGMLFWAVLHAVTGGAIDAGDPCEVRGFSRALWPFRLHGPAIRAPSSPPGRVPGRSSWLLLRLVRT